MREHGYISCAASLPDALTHLALSLGVVHVAESTFLQRPGENHEQTLKVSHAVVPSSREQEARQANEAPAPDEASGSFTLGHAFSQGIRVATRLSRVQSRASPILPYHQHLLISLTCRWQRQLLQQAVDDEAADIVSSWTRLMARKSVKTAFREN